MKDRTSIEIHVNASRKGNENSFSRSWGGRWIGLHPKAFGSIGACCGYTRVMKASASYYCSE
jgi:hypothetical protein